MAFDASPESGTAPREPDAGAPGAAEVDEAMQQLRALLVTPAIEPEREEVRQLREEVRAGRVDVQQLADALPDAVRLSGADGEKLADALSPTVDRAIEVSIENNPQPMIDAIFPIIGPAIRKAVSDALAKAVSGLNETLEHSLSLQSVRWRLEAKRTGKTFAEVLMLNTLRYRVEQVFLIHAETGLLLHHVVAPGVSARDADLVSGMLTAVTDFVKDSFGTDDDAGAGLQKLRVGGSSVWVERGPHAVLAAAVRGEGPEQLREVLEESVESVHQRFHDELENFDGDNAVFVGTDPDLARCLRSAQMPGRRGGRLKRWLVVGLLVASAGVVTGLAVQSSLRWRGLVRDLRGTRGFMLVDENHNWWGRSQLTGFYSVTAPKSPGQIVTASDVPASEVDSDWRLFPGLETRAEDGPPAPETPVDVAALLDAPDGVGFASAAGDDQHWVAAGAARGAWLERARQQVAAGLGPLGPGAVDLSGVTDLDVGLAAAAAALAAVEVPVPQGVDLSADLTRDRLAQAARYAADVAQLARKTGHRFTLEVIGHTDAMGDPEANQALSLARAQAAAAALRAIRPASSGGNWVIVTRGAGSSEPRGGGVSRANEQVAERRVTLKARLEPR